MPRPSNYQKMSLKALIAERDKIGAAIEQKLSAEREAFRTEVKEKASMLGMDLRALFGKKRRAPANGGRASVAVKFRNPKTRAKHGQAGVGQLDGSLERPTATRGSLIDS